MTTEDIIFLLMGALVIVAYNFGFWLGYKSAKIQADYNAWKKEGEK